MPQRSQENCPQCGEAIASDAPQGLCPKCVLQNITTLVVKESKSSPLTTKNSGGNEQYTPDEIAAHFEDLEVLELIGAGGMGSVYKARQTTLDRVVALKILPKALASNPALQERFEREARMLARLHHPNIVTVFEAGSAGPLNYIIME